MRVVFVGPCIAKIDEAADIRHNNDVDAVLTFDDLEKWLKEENIVIDDAQPASFLNSSSKILRMYPVAQGILASLESMGDTSDWKMLSVSGSAECIDFCRAMERGELNHCVIEINMCRGSCINGPVAIKDSVSRFSNTVKIKQYADEDCEEYPRLPEQIPMGMQFVDRSAKEDIPDEATIRSILLKIGKESPADELNCGSCGYPTCRDKAVAVYQGKAELTMDAIKAADVVVKLHGKEEALMFLRQQKESAYYVPAKYIDVFGNSRRNDVFKQLLDAHILKLQENKQSGW